MHEIKSSISQFEGNLCGFGSRTGSTRATIEALG